MSEPVESPGADPSSERVRLDYPGCDIWIRVTSPMEAQWRARSCTKEPWTVEWIENHINTGEVLYDIGANVGTFSLLAARQRGAVVVAFEPGYSNFARLCENIQLNDCQHAIVPLPFPVADATGLVGFKYRTLDPGQSRHSLRREPWRFRDAASGGRYEQPVCAIRLDEAIERFGLPTPHHLKIDVDGAEERVLAGADRTLSSQGLRTVLIEIDAARWEPAAALLQAAGLRLEQQYNREKAPAPRYGLFVREADAARPWWAFWR